MPDIMPSTFGTWEDVARRTGHAKQTVRDLLTGHANKSTGPVVKMTHLAHGTWEDVARRTGHAKKLYGTCAKSLRDMPKKSTGPVVKMTHLAHGTPTMVATQAYERTARHRQPQAEDGGLVGQDEWPDL